MARGHCRLSQHRQYSTKMARRPTALAAGTVPGLKVRSFAVNALALTGAAVSALTPARAVTLGEVTVESSIGQPLSARIPVELAPGEILAAACISAPAGGAASLMRLPPAQVSAPDTTTAGTYALRVTTAQPLYEPMYELQLQVRCPGTALLVRQYVLMLDLPGYSAGPPISLTSGPTASIPDSSVAPAAAVDVRPTALPEPVRARPVRPHLPVPLGPPIEPGSRYRVGQGDSLSTIAARIRGRSTSLWHLSDQIFAANPDAFIAGSQDLIKLGSEILIPANDGTPDSANPPAAAPADGVVPAEAVNGAAPAAAVAVESALAGTLVEEFADAVPPTAALPAEAPVFADEKPVPTPAKIKHAAPVATADESGHTSPWLAALIGLLIGALVSLVLLRQRLVDALRGLLARPTLTSGRATTSANQVTKRMLPAESAMVVVEERHAEPDGMPAVAATTAATALARPALADSGFDSDLANLFEDESGQSGTHETDVSTLPSAENLDLDLSAAAVDVAVDQGIGWIGDETAMTPTEQASTLRESGGESVEELDLQTLSQKATGETQISQTFKDALTLLESDYENELTASQVIDHSKLKQILEDEGNDSLVRTGTDHKPRR